MTETVEPQKQSHATQPMPIPESDPPTYDQTDLPSSKVNMAHHSHNSRAGHLNIDFFSPVNQNGSFEFDRVLRSGEVSIRSRKTKVCQPDAKTRQLLDADAQKQWKRFYLVLRPNLLSMYKNASEEKLLKQVNLADVTAVAHTKDPKGRREHMFSLFSPSRNFHIQACSEGDAQEWVELIRHEARIDEEESMTVGHASTEAMTQQRLEHDLRSSEEQDRLGSSSPEPLDITRSATTRDGVRIPGVRKSSMQELEYSGNEHGSHSDFSDSAPPPSQLPASSPPSSTPLSFAQMSASATAANVSSPSRSQMWPVSSQMNGADVDVGDERVIWHGYLLSLRSKGGVRQWKKLWVVLRPKNLALYKNEEVRTLALTLGQTANIGKRSIQLIFSYHYPTS